MGVVGCDSLSLQAHCCPHISHGFRPPKLQIQRVFGADILPLTTHARATRGYLPARETPALLTSSASHMSMSRMATGEYTGILCMVGGITLAAHTAAAMARATKRVQKRILLNRGGFANSLRASSGCCVQGRKRLPAKLRHFTAGSFQFIWLPRRRIVTLIFSQRASAVR